MNNDPKNRITPFADLHGSLEIVEVEDTPSNTAFGQNDKGELTILPTQGLHYRVHTSRGVTPMLPLVLFKPRDPGGKRECIVRLIINGKPLMGIPLQLRSAKLMEKWFGEIGKALEAKSPEEPK